MGIWPTNLDPKDINSELGLLIKGIIFLVLGIKMIEILQNFRGIMLTMLINFTLENFTYFQK